MKNNEFKFIDLRIDWAFKYVYGSPGNKYGDTGEVWLKYNEALDTVRYMDQNKMKPSHIKRT